MEQSSFEHRSRGDAISPPLTALMFFFFGSLRPPAVSTREGTNPTAFTYPGLLLAVAVVVGRVVVVVLVLPVGVV